MNAGNMAINKNTGNIMDWANNVNVNNVTGAKHLHQPQGTMSQQQIPIISYDFEEKDDVDLD